MVLVNALSFCWSREGVDYHMPPPIHVKSPTASFHLIARSFTVRA
uniref:Uncharacterized protein n=1 Tax=Anguilla anguilla TaxID=7936 RepID=A0A0E9QHI3_ANGAN